MADFMSLYMSPTKEWSKNKTTDHNIGCGIKTATAVSQPDFQTNDHGGDNKWWLTRIGTKCGS